MKILRFDINLHKNSNIFEQLNNQLFRVGLRDGFLSARSVSGLIDGVVILNKGITLT